MVQDVGRQGVGPSYDQDYWNWRKLVDWDLSALPGKPGLCEFPDTRIRKIYESGKTPSQAAAALAEQASA